MRQALDVSRNLLRRYSGTFVHKYSEIVAKRFRLEAPNYDVAHKAVYCEILK